MKIKDWFFKVWRDPVWSKVISAGILIAISITWAKITNHSWDEIYNFVLAGLSFSVPLYVFLSAVALYFLVRKGIQLFRQRKDAFWDESMGNYTFKDLHNILLTEKLPIQTMGMGYSGIRAPEDDLMLLFQTYYSMLNTGFGFYDNIDDGGYLYGVLAPRLVGYGLVEVYEQSDDNLPGQTNKAFRISEMGHRFHAALDKLLLKEKIKEYKANKKETKKEPAI